jgi:hypothetical protein
MLIKVPTKTKNPYWEKRGITPNEAYAGDGGYRRLVDAFKIYNHISAQSRFFEVRVSKQSPLATSTGQVKWWDDPLFMEKVLWVFQQPHVDRVDDAPYPYYILEPYECMRVLNLGFEKYHRMPVGDPKAAFYIPVECCHHAWNETSAGYSDHLRPRPKIEPTQEETDRRATQEAEGRELLASAVDAANDPRFEEIHATLERAIKNGSSPSSSRLGKL